MHIHCDFETFSEVDIKRCGAYRYATHESTEALMLAWSIDHEPVQCVDLTANELPADLRRALLDPSCLIHAFNATFERLIFKYCLGIDIPAQRFICTAVLAYSYSFTGSLDTVLKQAGIEDKKDPEGGRLINKFSKLHKRRGETFRNTCETDPEDWEKFLGYCVKDVEVEMKLSNKMEQYTSNVDWGLYSLDQKINDYGVPIDRNLVNAALSLNDSTRSGLMSKLDELTQLDNPNSNPQLQGWLKDRGLDLPNMQKGTISDALGEGVSDWCRQALELKQQLAKTSTTKWEAFNRMLCDDDACHGMFQFIGASRTQRWAGRGVQLHNLTRGGELTKDGATAAEYILSQDAETLEMLYGDKLLSLLSDTLRSAIKAPEGMLLNVADLSSIESRVLGWISDCEKINQTFAAGLDTYKVFAMDMYGVPYDQVTKKQRGFCKPPVLGGGFGLGWKGLIGYAEGMGVTMADDEAQAAIEVFRSRYHEVPTFWDWCKAAVFHTTQTGEPFYGNHGLMTYAQGEFLMMRLPSGRSIAYQHPRIEMKEAPWGDMVEAFTFMGVDKFTKKWDRIVGTKGFICENIVQATARDILAVWMERADKAGFSIALHIHDEIVAVERTDRLRELVELIKTPIPWCQEMLLDADGYVAVRYRKD